MADHKYDVLKKPTANASKPTLSVVIPSYNTAGFVSTAIRSVTEQTFYDLEIIVVDDGSSDSSIERIMSHQDARLTCVRQKNRGLAAARNTGILLARGEFIGFLDSDDLWYPEKAAAHLYLMQPNPGIGLTFSHSAYLSEAGGETGQFLTTTCFAPKPRDLVFRNHVGNGSTPIIRSECFRRVGQFNESLRYGEDIEMWLRISVRSGLTLQLIPKVLTGYRVRQGSITGEVGRIIPNAEIAVSLFRNLVPDLSRQDANRAFAQILRVASRKAFSSGQVQASRGLLLTAWRRSPTLPIYDFKALVLLALNLCVLILPGNGSRIIYRGIRNIMKHVHACTGLRSSAKV